MKKLFWIFCTVVLLCCCKDSEEEEVVEGPFQRSVLVYVAGENGLSSYIHDELKQLREGSKKLGNNALLIYIDGAKANERPYFARIKEGRIVDSVALFKEDVLASDPDVFKKVLEYASEKYPANDYGLVLWGHASGWLLQDSIAYAGARKAYGQDNGSNNGSQYGNDGCWINMYTLAKMIETWGKPLKFIMADCCHFQCIESAYELRNATEYIIGSPAEIPGEGAPYQIMTQYMFDTSDDFYRDITDAYFSQLYNGLRVPLSVISTSQLEQFAWITGNVLKSLEWSEGSCPDLHGLIHYKGKSHNEVMYDMNDIMLHYLSDDAYKEWHEAFEHVVVYKTYTNQWVTNGQLIFNSFKMTEEGYGGVSMFVPQQRPFSEYMTYNQDIRKTSWYWAARLYELGW